MSRVERDPERGQAAAAKLKALGVKGILIKAAEQGYITQLACKMPECFRPEELGGACYFEPTIETISAHLLGREFDRKTSDAVLYNLVVIVDASLDPLEKTVKRLLGAVEARRQGPRRHGGTRLVQRRRARRQRPRRRRVGRRAP